MKSTFFTTALLLVAGALFAPKAHSQQTVPPPPGTTANPSPNTYNLDLASMDESYHTVSGSNPGADFYNDDGTHYSVFAMVSESSINQNFLMKNHLYGSIFHPGVSATSTFVQNWCWEGPNLPADYQSVYEESLGASIHLDGSSNGASFSGTLSYDGDDYGSHSDSISQYGDGTTMMGHLASDIYWHPGKATVSATMHLNAEMQDLWIGNPGVGTVAGPAVNDGSLDMLSGAYLFYPATEPEINPQISFDW